MNEPSPPTENEVNAVRGKLSAMYAEVQKVYIGQRAPVDLLLIAALARGHVLLEGVPGVAKTTLAKAFATSLGCTMRRIQLTPDLMPADITGTYVLSPKDGTFSFRRGPVFANIVLADEINRAPARTQSALLEAMQEQQVTVEGDMFSLPAPFLVLATQNPIEMEGTYPLPEAELDRFLIHIFLKYPTHRDEVRMLSTHSNVNTLSEPERVLEARQLVELQDMVSRVYVEPDLYDYAVSLSGYTRMHSHVVLGASPRATLGLIQASKAAALLNGRNYVAPEEIRSVAVPVLAHRLVLSPELEDEGMRAAEQIVQEAISKVSYRKQVRVV